MKVPRLSNLANKINLLEIVLVMLARISQLLTFYTPREFESKFIIHTKDSWEEQGRQRQVQTG